MAIPVRAPETPRDPASMRGHAMEHLRFIRRTMESATSFTAVPGRGGMLVGLSALIAAALASGVQGTRDWALVWVAEALVALTIGGWAMARKARGARVRLSGGAGRRFVLGLSPPLVAAGVLTLVLIRSGSSGVLAGMWLLLYGAAVIAGGTFSVRPVPVMGLCFMILGVVTLALPDGFATTMMALGFGGLHVVFGAVIARKYGG